MIPKVSKGIPRKTLGELVIEFKRGLSSYYLQGKGSNVSFINIKDIQNGRVNINTVETVRVKETDALTKTRIEPNDVIISIKGSSFKAAVADDSVKGYIISANLIAFKINSIILPDIVVAYLNSPKGQSELQSMSAGAVQKALNLKSLMGITIPIPEKNKQKIIFEYLTLFKEYNFLFNKEQKIRKNISNKIISNLLGGR